MASGVLVVFGGKKADEEQPQDRESEVEQTARDDSAPAATTGRSDQAAGSQSEAQRDEEARLSAAERRRKRLARLASSRLRGRS